MSNNTPNFRQQARRVAPRGLVWQPEHSFCAAMLMQCLMDGMVLNRRYYRPAARYWMTQASEEPGGFVWCCRGVLLDPVATRAAILARWKEGLPDGRRRHFYRAKFQMRGNSPTTPGVTDPLL